MPSAVAWRRSAGQRARRKHLRPGVQAVEILADHPRVVEHGAFIGDQARDLAERIVGDEIRIRRDRGHHPPNGLEPFVQPRLDRDRHDLAHVRRRGVVVQSHALCLLAHQGDCF
jgi:hypothetical protein